jgi:8-oxo-dGTP diphosphatase
MANLLKSEILYCIRCGTLLIESEQFGRLRPTCPACGWIYFSDPKVAAAAYIEQQGKVLLVRRAGDPLRGRWSLPAGFIDAGEDPVEAILRECAEETGLVVGVTGLVDVFYGQEHPRGAHIVIVYRAEVLGGTLRPGDDADLAAFFSPDNLPELAFSTTLKVLNRFS